MKTLKYLWILFAVGFFAACTDDEFSPNSSESTNNGDQKEVIISISANDLIQVDMNKSRVVSNNNINKLLAKVNDINVRITKTDNTHVSFYCVESTNAIKLIEGDQNSGPSYVNNNSGFPIAENIKIHTDLKSSEISNIEVIANYGKPWNQVTSNKKKGYTTASSVKWEDIAETSVDQMHPGSVDFNIPGMMYGSVQKPTGTTEHITSKPCANYTVKLKRSRAMITLKLDATGLKEGVEILPKKMRLCNVPSNCNMVQLGKDANKIKGNSPTTANRLAKSQEVYSGLGSLTRGKILGGHADNSTGEFTPNHFFPLFMFENMQGTYNEVNKDHKVKYPGGITNVAEAKDENKNFKYSYIEIEAEYIYREGKPNTGSTVIPVKFSGNIIYRFFLGKDETTNFDIQGNHYYRLTLNLSNYGGAREDGKVDKDGNLVVNTDDVSWRVDLKLNDWGFAKDQFDFDGHYVYGATDVIPGTTWQFTGVTAGQGDASWVTLNVASKGQGVEWMNPTEIMKNKVELKIDNDGRLAFQVEPMSYQKGGILDPSGLFDENTYKLPKNYREMKIGVKCIKWTGQEPKNKEQTITVRQYAPIPIVTKRNEIIFMERFEEYFGNINGFPWGYEGNNLSSLDMDVGGYKQPYKYGDNLVKDDVGTNSLLLSPKYQEEWDPKANANVWVLKRGEEYVGTIGHAAYRKGMKHFQGADANYWATPSVAMMEKIFEYKHEPNPGDDWGPYEPVHYFEDYWTSTVLNGAKTETQFYNGTNHKYESTRQRALTKRLRAIYTVQNVTTTPKSKK